MNARVKEAFGWDGAEEIVWLSPLASDNYAEYYDQDFLDKLEVKNLAVPLDDFWPASGPRWDGLAKTKSGKLLLVEAKAYIEEGVDFESKAGPQSAARINTSLARAKSAFEAAQSAPWERPFYQYANRLAHLYFARQLNGLDAYLLFLCFADAGDVPRPTKTDEWRGASRLIEKCLGLGTAHPFRPYVKTLIWSVPEMEEQAARDTAQ